MVNSVSYTTGSTKQFAQYIVYQVGLLRLIFNEQT
jgi:hypothetical protein